MGHRSPRTSTSRSREGGSMTKVTMAATVLVAILTTACGGASGSTTPPTTGSPPNPATRPSTPATVGGFGDAAVVLAGLGLLMWRVVAPASILTPATLALLYAVVLSMSLTGSPGITPRPVPATSAAVLGAAAVTATRSLAGPAFGSVNMASAFPLGIAAAIAGEAFFRRFLYSRRAR